jgi:hypothetical protein
LQEAGENRHHLLAEPWQNPILSFSMKNKSPAELEAERQYIALLQGNSDPRQMAGYLFGGAKRILWETAVKAKREQQRPATWPRYWYVEADFECRDCHREFIWTVAEQRLWFEVYKLSTDAYPQFCLPCRRKSRHLAALRKEYDATIPHARQAGTKEEKHRILEILNELLQANPDLPEAMLETKTCFERQTAKMSGRV